MTTDVELLPCPFCGEEMLREFNGALFVHPDPDSSECPIRFQEGYTDEDATAWNRRANVVHATAAKDAEIERLRAEVERLQSINSGLCRKSNYYLIDSARWQERAERLAEEIDWIKSQPEGDRMFAEIEAAAKASFHRHRTSCRGQVLTRADNYESHLVWATLEWAKRTNGAEQPAERLAEALRELLIDMMLAQSSMRRAAKTDPRWEGCDEAIQPRVDAARAALRDHDQEGHDE